ncbi:MAG: hypothetical protein ACK57J_19685 [Rubrivivax sp.]
MIKYLLAVFLFGQEATLPPTLVSPHTSEASCFAAQAELTESIKAQGAAGEAYAACLKIVVGPEV